MKTDNTIKHTEVKLRCTYTHIDTHHGLHGVLNNGWGRREEAGKVGKGLRGGWDSDYSQQQQQLWDTSAGGRAARGEQAHFPSCECTSIHMTCSD